MRRTLWSFHHYASAPKIRLAATVRVANLRQNILRAAVAEDAVPPRNLAEAIRRRFQPLGGVWLRLPARDPVREPPKPGK